MLKYIHTHIKLIITVIASAILIGYFATNQTTTFEFKRTNNEPVLFNNEELIPPFSSDTKTYLIPSVSLLNDNIISVGSQKQKIKLKNIKAISNIKIKIKINSKKYTLHFLPPDSSNYSMFNYEKESNNLILLTSFDGYCEEKSYATILNEKGEIVYYHHSEPDRCVSDFKQTILPNGKKYYSFMQQTEKMPPWSYWSGKLQILDENFQYKKSLTLLETDKHPALGVENHDSLILDENHYILTAYHTKEVFHPITQEPIYIAENIIQEIKDGKVLLDWASSEYDELLLSYKGDMNPEETKAIDYLHINSVIIDPKDNNLIVSFASISQIIKINRKTGEIIWRLGGMNDEFNLDKEYLFWGQHTLSLTPDGYLMLFDNQSSYFMPMTTGDKNLQTLTDSRILKFKLDEKNKKVLETIAITTGPETKSLGSAYQTKKDTYIISLGKNKMVKKIQINEYGYQRNIWELTIKNPTYRAYEIK